MKMKKFALILATSIMVLAIIACNFPVTFIGESTAPATEEVETPPQASGDTAVYRDNGVEITLSNTFVLGNPETDLAAAADGGGLSGLYAENAEDILLWAYQNDPQTSVMVLKNEEYAGMPLGIISTFAGSILGDAVTIVTKEQMKLGGRDVLRFLTTTDNAGVTTTQAVYLFNEDGKLWLIVFFTNQDQIGARLPAFNSAVASFTIVSVD